MVHGSTWLLNCALAPGRPRYLAGGSEICGRYPRDNAARGPFFPAVNGWCDFICRLARVSHFSILVLCVCHVNGVCSFFYAVDHITKLLVVFALCRHIYDLFECVVLQSFVTRFSLLFCRNPGIRDNAFRRPFLAANGRRDFNCGTTTGCRFLMLFWLALWGVVCKLFKHANLDYIVLWT